MNTINVDVAIIGAGSAGLNARREVEKAGKSVLLIESGPYGTTCARVGCMPSKLLIAAADAAHEVERAGMFGIEVDGFRVDAPKVFARVRAERDRFVGFVADDTENLPPEQLLRGHARFTGPNSLMVDDHSLVNAGTTVIASGSSPFIPPPFDVLLEEAPERLLVNDDVFELDEVPETLAVIGTGIIGLELGQALQRLGATVTFFNPFPQIGPFTDPEVQRVSRDILGAELELQTESRVHDVSVHDEGVELQWTDRSGELRKERFEKVLVAAGRRPNLEGLDLQATGLELNDRGQPEWDARTCQAGDSPIFLAGDISGHRPLLHEASDEGRIAGANAAQFPRVCAHVRREPLAVAFTDPNMAMIGRSYAELDPQQVEIGEVSFANQGRARVMGKNQGLLRVYGDRKTCTLIGAEMIGPRAEHYAHLLAWAVQQNMPVTQILRMPFYHPVIEEGVRTALRDLADKLRVRGECRGEDLATSAGM